MNITTKFILFLRENSDILNSDTHNYIINNGENLTVLFDGGNIDLYLNDCDHFIDSDYFTPSMLDDCHYTSRSSHLLNMYNVHGNREELMKDYQLQLKNPMWKERRAEIIEKSNNQCSLCGEKEKLQVHHKRYISGRLAWEYEDDILECLCNNCHYKHHEKEINASKNDFIIRNSISRADASNIVNIRAEIITRMNDEYVNYIVSNLRVVDVTNNKISFDSNYTSYYKHFTKVQKEVIAVIKGKLVFDLRLIRKNYKFNPPAKK